MIRFTALVLLLQAVTAHASYNTYDLENRLQYGYDANGNRRQLIDHNNRVTQYSYDELNRLRSINAPLAGQVVYDYYNNSQLRQIDWPNGIRSHYQYDGAERIASIQHQLAASSFAEAQYDYDLNGNRSQQIITQGTQTEQTSYDYDTADRLTQINEPNRSIEYILDGVANRLTETITDNNQTTTQDKTYSYNSRDQLEQVQDAISGALITYQYDADGNQISKTDMTGTTNLVYGPRDRLLTITLPGAPPIAYSYNEAGLRDSQSQNGQTLHYIYDQTSLIAETNTTGDELARYTHSSVGLIAEARSGVQTYLHTDALSTPIAITDTSGAVTSRYTWDTWGKLQQQTGISQQPFGFTGYQRDAQTGLHYAQQRYYDSEIGRFNRHDPFRGEINTPLSLHRYLYANANPTIYVDPDGRAAVIGPAELETLGLAVENERGIIDPAQGVLALLRERGLEDLIESREIFTTNVARRTPFIGPEAVRQAVNLLAEASINDNPPMAFVVAESGDTPESVLKFARNFIGDTGGVSSRELTLPASTVDSLPGDVIDISFELQDALAGAQEAANNRFINKVANQFQEFRNKQSRFVSGSLAVSQFLVNAVADTETALAQSSLNPFTPLAPQPLRSNANVTLGAEIIAGGFGRVVTLGRLGSNVNATDDVFEVIRGVTVSRSRFRESAGHIEDAVSAGRSNTLTIDRAGSTARRREALRGTETKRALDRDEFPPAMFQEGGRGASVRHINPADNRGAGACIGAQCRTLPDGTRVRIDVVD